MRNGLKDFTWNEKNFSLCSISFSTTMSFWEPRIRKIAPTIIQRNNLLMLSEIISDSYVALFENYLNLFQISL